MKKELGKPTRVSLSPSSMNVTLTSLLRRLHPIKGFRYESARLDSEQHPVILVEVAARAGSKGICSGCGKKGPCYDRCRKRHWKFVPLWGLMVFLVYAARRIDCQDCGVRVERLPWAQGKNHLCDVFAAFLGHWARKLSWRETAMSFGCSWWDVYRAVSWLVAWGKERRQWGSIQAIGIDEIYVGVRRRFWTLVYQIDDQAKRLLWVGRDRTENTLHTFFDELPDQVRLAIRYVCSDMWKAYLKVVRIRLPGVLHVLDRFHIRKNQNEAVDKVRRQEARALAEAGLAPLLKKMRWAFLKRRSNWSKKERRRMRELQSCSLRTLRAFLLVEAFDHFWTYKSVAWARKFLRAWCEKVSRSRLEPLQKVAKTMKQHEELLLNYFRARKLYSSGIVEGLNNKVKLTIRRSYGFRSSDVLEVALFHNFGNLPEPAFTHRFF